MCVTIACLCAKRFYWLLVLYLRYRFLSFNKSEIHYPPYHLDFFLKRISVGGWWFVCVIIAFLCAKRFFFLMVWVGG